MQTSLEWNAVLGSAVAAARLTFSGSMQTLRAWQPAKARLIAEGYRKARADAQRPGDIVFNELDQQLRAFRATAGKKRGLRLDGTIRHFSSGDEVWFDVTATHSTCHSKLLKELRLTKLRKTAGKIGNRIKSAAVLDAHTKKRDKYALLEAIVERQLI
jgi:hypothetical protein